MEKMKYTLRPYQELAIEKLTWAMTMPGNDVISIAQGGGKSLIIADFVHRTSKPALILSPTREILKQNMDKLLTYVPPVEVGVYSASMSRKDLGFFTFATIGSIYKKPEVFKDFNLAIVDECDLVPTKKMNSMYNKFFKAANIKKVIGFTGTPFRQDTYYEEPPWGWEEHRRRKAQGRITPLKVVTTTKMITRYADGFWQRMLYVLNTDQLMEEGYLSPLKYVDRTLIGHNDLKLNKSESEFDLEDYEEKISEKYNNILRTVAWAYENRDNVLVFCTSIKQANLLSGYFKDSAVVTSETKKRERNKIIKNFKEGKIKIVFNVSVLTVGFDFPELNTIILLRPTRSLRLHLQILGRGTRIHKDKDHCLVIDLAGNVGSLGKLEEIRVTKVDGKWDVVSPSQPEGFHNKPLFSFYLQQ